MVSKTMNADASSGSAHSAAMKPDSPRLRAPARDEAWRVSPLAASPEPASSEARLGSGEHLLVETRPAGRGTLISGMVLAVCIVVVVLAGMAILSHGNGGSPQAPQTTTAPPR
jgi:hypothetical protein